MSIRDEFENRFFFECFHIDEDWRLIWKIRPAHHFPSQRAAAAWNSRYSGQFAGGEYLNPASVTTYIIVRFKYKGVQVSRYAHQIIWAMVMGAWPCMPIDHIDGNGTNNNPSNLRLVDSSESGKNRPKQTNNKSGVPGLWIDPRGYYRVQGSMHGLLVHLGYFRDFFLAVCAKKSFEAHNGFHENHGRESAGVRAKP
jgi:hypothetical protein